MIFVAQSFVVLDSKAIRLIWNPNPEPDIDHYDIRMSKVAEGPFASIGVSKTNRFDWGDPMPGKYYFQIVPYDTSGNYGPVSDTISLDLLPPMVVPKYVFISPAQILKVGD